MTSAKFEETYTKTREIKSGPSNDELLDLYAYAKIAKKEDFSKAKKPGTLDFTGKAKYKQWEKYVNEGVTPEDAEQKYIALGQGLINKHLK